MNERVCSQHSGVVQAVQDLRKHIDVRFDSVDKSINIAKAEMDRRLEAMNEFRDQLTRQAATFVPKSEMHLQIDRIEERISEIRINQQAMQRTLDIAGGARKWSDHIITVLIGALVLIGVYIINTTCIVK